MDSETKQAPKLPSVTQLIRDSWEFFKQNRKAIWRIQSFSFAAAIVPIAVALLSLSIAWATSARFNDYILQLMYDNSPRYQNIFGENIAWVIGLAISIYIIYVVFVGIIALTSYRSIFQLCHGIFVSYKQTFITTLKTLHSVLWIGILANLITRGGSLLLIIPGIIMYVLVKFSLFENYSDIQGKRGLKAIIGSWKITRPYFMAVFGRYVALSIIAFLVVIIPVVVVVLVGFIIIMSYSKLVIWGFVIGLVIVALAGLLIILAGVFALSPMMIRYEWGMFSELKKRDALLILSPDVEATKYRRRKIIAIVLAILGILYTGITSFWGQSNEYNGAGPVSIIEGCGDVRGKHAAYLVCGSLLTKSQIEEIARKSSQSPSDKNTDFVTASGMYKISVVDGWKAADASQEDRGLNLTLIKPVDETVPAFVFIVSNKNTASMLMKDKIYFTKNDGTPDTKNQESFIYGVLNGSKARDSLVKNSIYRIDDNIVSMTTVVNEGSKSEGQKNESWIFFTHDDPFLISMTAPLADWDKYRADMYKMALSFAPVQVNSTVK